ncbi:uncharacterized protein LOC115766595 [Drosophila novamexicana]|uniref:uncharacterized protein LOC115766595 n=1 Tax=Drosophila novamexicana TaxID=47314 RepID=UPI0011E59FFF|nr:uncharacterized protein LOC115766595 [Drosophila novamexicana]
MDIEQTTPEVSTAHTVDLNNDRLDCEHLDELTERWVDPNRPSFITVLLRFFGNIFVDCFRAIFS